MEQKRQAEAKRKELEDQRAERKEALLEPPMPPRQMAQTDDSYDKLDALHASRTMVAPQESADKPWWQSAWDWTADHAGKIVESVKSGVKSWNVKDLKFNKLEDGHISVSAETPPGTRLDYKASVGDAGFDFAGTRYNPETVAGITSEGLLKGAVPKNGLIFGGIVSLA